MVTNILSGVLLVVLASGPAASAPGQKTGPASWRKAGAFGVRFGMGPGDVKKVHPSVSRVANSACPHEVSDEERAAGMTPCPWEYWAFRSELGGENCRVSLTFFRGRLYSLSAVPTDELDEADREAWSQRILRLLEEKYGLGESSASELGFGIKRWTMGEAVFAVLVLNSHLKYEVSDEARSADRALSSWMDDREKVRRKLDLEKL